MNWVDFLLLVLVAVSGIHGLRLGAASQVLSFGGFWLGLFLGALVAPALVGLAKGRDSRSLIAMGVVFGAAFVLGGVGQLFGARSASALRRLRLGALDSAAGVAVAVVATLVAAWLVGSFLANSRYTTLDAALQRSHILARHRQRPPPGAVGLLPDRVVSRLRGISHRLRRPSPGGRPAGVAAQQSRRPSRCPERRAVDCPDRGSGLRGAPGGIGIRGCLRSGGHECPCRRGRGSPCRSRRCLLGIRPHLCSSIPDSILPCCGCPG